MTDDARTAFISMVRDCGNDIVRMQASFEMYLNQYMVDYPEEKKLLLDAFRVGIPEKILQHAGDQGYDKYLQNLGPRFAEAGRRPVEEAAWGVETWALALNRTADYVAPVVQERVYLDDLIPEESEAKKFATGTAMAVIVSSGGALGAGLASLVWPLAMTAMGLSAQIYVSSQETPVKTDAEQILAIAIIFFMSAMVGGLGALGGWLFGRGSELPWSGFSVAFFTAMTMFFIIGAVGIPLVPGIIWKPVVLFGCVFGSVYKTAARGGNY